MIHPDGDLDVTHISGLLETHLTDHIGTAFSLCQKSVARTFGEAYCNCLWFVFALFACFISPSCVFCFISHWSQSTFCNAFYRYPVEQTECL